MAGMPPLVRVLLLFVGLLVAPGYGGGIDGTCIDLAVAEGQLISKQPTSGIIAGYVPTGWCLHSCAGWRKFSLGWIALLVIQFILPVVIFALVVPRRWHLDFPSSMFDLRPSNLANAGKLLVSALLVGPVACADMILWVSAILTLSGPMISSGLLEIYLDLKAVMALRDSRNAIPAWQLSEYERQDVLVSLLCGNFEGNHTVRGFLSPLMAPPTDMPTSQTKDRLMTILTSQTTFGSSTGVATLFFLGGFLYSALSINQLTAVGADSTPYAIWLMIMIYVAMISATCLTGNNPATLTVLLDRHRKHRLRNWRHLFVDYYEDELHPTSMWDRGMSKWDWLKDSEPYRNKDWFAEKINPGTAAWIGINLLTIALTVFPGVMAYQIAYHIPYRQEGCRSLSYALYCGCQVWLALVAAQRSISRLAYDDFPVVRASTKYLATWQNVLRRLFYSLATVMTAIALLLSFIISLPGTIFQIFGLYNNCICQSDVGSWIKPVADRLTLVVTEYVTKEYIDYVTSFGRGITWASAMVTAVLCYLAWWYQKVLRRAVAAEIEHL